MPPYAYPDRHDELSTALVRSVEPYEGYWAASERFVLDRTIRRLAAAPRANRTRLLDAGCGDGRLFRVFAPYVDEIVGIDPDGARLAAAERTVAEASFPTTVRLLHSGIEEYTGAGSFDVILCSHVIQHVATAAVPRIIGALAGRLAPGGRIVLLTNHSTADEDRFVRAEPADHDGTGIREVPVSRDEFDRLARGAGVAGALPIHFFTRGALERLLVAHQLTITDFACFHISGDFGDLESVVGRDTIVNALPALQRVYGRDVYIEALGG